MTISKKLITFGILFSLLICMGPALLAQVEDSNKEVEEVNKVAKGLEKVRALRADGKLEKASSLLKDLNELASDNDIMVMLIQVERLSLVSAQSTKGDYESALKEYRRIFSNYHSRMENEGIRQTLMIASKGFPTLLELNADETDKVKLAALNDFREEGFGLIGESIGKFRKFETKDDINQDTIHIATLMGARAELAKSIGQPSLGVSQKELQKELKRLRKFCKENADHEKGILALNELLESATAGISDRNSKEFQELRHERDVLLANAMKNPDASYDLAKYYSYFLASESSRVAIDSPNMEADLTAIEEKLKELSVRFEAKFDRDVEQIRQRKAQYKEFKEKRKKRAQEKEESRGR